MPKNGLESGEYVGEIKYVMKESVYASYFLQVEQIVLKMWEKMTILLHCLGFAFPQ